MGSIPIWRIMYGLENLNLTQKLIIGILLGSLLATILFVFIINPLNCHIDDIRTDELKTSCEMCLKSHNYSSWDEIKTIRLYKDQCPICQDYENYAGTCI